MRRRGVHLAYCPQNPRLVVVIVVAVVVAEVEEAFEGSNERRTPFSLEPH